MTVTKSQAQMIATLARDCRPHGASRWDMAGVMAALEQVRDRNLASVVMAVIRAASDRDVDTPGVIPKPGSHWQEAASVAPSRPPVVDKADRCGICSKSRADCPKGRHADDDHAFEAPGPRAVVDVPRVVAAIKDELAPVAPPPEPRGLTDLAHRRPELIEAADRIAQANPGLRQGRECEAAPTGGGGEDEAAGLPREMEAGNG